MRKHVTATAVICCLMLQRPEPAQAGVATEFTQVLNHGQLVMEYIRQGQQLATQIDQYKDQRLLPAPLRRVVQRCQPALVEEYLPPAPAAPDL